MDMLVELDPTNHGANGGSSGPPGATHDPSDPERRFCPQCGNMWQPREERTTRTLMLNCRNCGYEEPATSYKVYENRIKKEVSTRLDIINPEITDDPTLQRSNDVVCENCNYSEAVLFQAESGITAKSLSLIFVCCNCKHKWIG
uniref:TFIIS-type domain-containing protein n=1 Tax=Aureoumbra lagunensis TaxID=44058 RepID=A0A7S3NJ32_9STRA|mmetsp:Transcript_23282/g.28000  ORF Transcript_23282/g.28000 Transcript_23282/m.28000 type:complete len:144 (+) Transcript_23282:19-450(+)